MIIGSMNSNILANMSKLLRIIRYGTHQTSNETHNECNGVKSQDTPIALNTSSRRAGAEQPEQRSSLDVAMAAEKIVTSRNLRELT